MAREWKACLHISDASAATITAQAYLKVSLPAYPGKATHAAHASARRLIFAVVQVCVNRSCKQSETPALTSSHCAQGLLAEHHSGVVTAGVGMCNLEHFTAFTQELQDVSTVGNELLRLLLERHTALPAQVSTASKISLRCPQILQPCCHALLACCAVTMSTSAGSLAYGRRPHQQRARQLADALQCLIAWAKGLADCTVLDRP